MDTLNEKNSPRQYKTILNSDEVAALNIKMAEGNLPPEPTVCQFCGKRLCYEAIVLFGRVILWRRNEPERCTCDEAITYWAEQELLEEKHLAEEKQREERETQKKKIDRLRGSSGIKNRFQTRTFETFRETSQNRYAKAAAQKYADQFDSYLKDGYGIYFEGTCGTGKTHLAVAIALRLLNNGIPVVFRTGCDLLFELRECYGNTSALTEKQVMNAYAAADLLIIDDLGKEKPTEWAIDRLYSIINERYESLKPMIVTTNYSQDELIERLTPEEKCRKTAEAIVSRLRECTGVISLIGEDWRSLK